MEMSALHQLSDNLPEHNNNLSDVYLSEPELARLDKLPISKQIQILEHLVKIFDPKTISNYCRINGIKRSSIYEKDKDELPHIIIDDTTFIFNNF
jgi:hypothetical protein